MGRCAVSDILRAGCVTIAEFRIGSRHRAGRGVLPAPPGHKVPNVAARNSRTTNGSRIFWCSSPTLLNHHLDWEILRITGGRVSGVLFPRFRHLYCQRSLRSGRGSADIR